MLVHQRCAGSLLHKPLFSVFDKNNITKIYTRANVKLSVYTWVYIRVRCRRKSLERPSISYSENRRMHKLCVVLIVNKYVWPISTGCSKLLSGIVYVYFFVDFFFFFFEFDGHLGMVNYKTVIHTVYMRDFILKYRISRYRFVTRNFLWIFVWVARATVAHGSSCKYNNREHGTRSCFA